jgi:hypothetical protein
VDFYLAVYKGLYYKEGFMKKIALLVSMLVVFATGSSAWAALTHTMANGSEIIGINALVGSLTYTVDQLSGGQWDYLYAYTPSADKPRGVGAISIEFGSLPSNLSSSLTYSHVYQNTAVPAVTYPNLASGLQAIDRTALISYTNATDPTGSDVSVHTTFQGLQWVMDTSNPVGSVFTLHLITDLAPVWGDFYMDGYNTTSNNGYGMVRNTNYDINATQAFSLTGPILAGYIPTPGAAAPVPIPPSVLLFGSGLSGLFFFRRKKIEC